MAGCIWRLQSTVLQTTTSPIGLLGLFAPQARIEILDIDVSLKGTALGATPPTITIYRSTDNGTVPGDSLNPVPWHPNNESPLFTWNGRQNMPFWLLSTEVIWQGFLHPKGGSLARRQPSRFPFAINESRWLIVQIESAVDYPCVAGVTFER